VEQALWRVAIYLWRGLYDPCCFRAGAPGRAARCRVGAASRKGLGGSLARASVAIHILPRCFHSVLVGRQRQFVARCRGGHKRPRDRASCVAGHYCIRSRPRLSAPKPTARFLFKPQSQQKTGLWQQLPCHIAALNSRCDRVTTTQSLKLVARKIFEACMGQTEVEGGRSQTACREAGEQPGRGLRR
jgi:hypothetical protein